CWAPGPKYDRSSYSRSQEETYMRRRMEAVPSTHAEAPARRRGRLRGLRRAPLFASLLGLFVLVGGVEASTAAPFIQKATPNFGCPGETVTLTGTGFASGDIAHFKNTAVTPNNDNVSTSFISSTEETAYIPIFLVATSVEEKGTLKVEQGNKMSNEVAFSFTP